MRYHLQVVCLQSLRAWDEKKVADWLKSIGCAAYTDLFKGSFTYTFIKIC